MFLKKDSFVRQGRAFIKYISMLFRPTAITLSVLIAWMIAHRSGLHFSEKSTDFIAIVEVILVIPFGLLATAAVNTAQAKHDNIVVAVFEKDRHRFLRYRDEKILIGIHVIMLTFASLIILMAGMLNVTNIYEGGLIVSAVSFSLSLIWEVIRQLENPRTSFWIVERTPAEWFEVEVDTEFWAKEDSG